MMLQLTSHNSLHMQPFHLGTSEVRMQIYQAKSIINIDLGTAFPWQIFVLGSAGNRFLESLLQCQWRLSQNRCWC